MNQDWSQSQHQTGSITAQGIALIKKSILALIRALRLHSIQYKNLAHRGHWISLLEVWWLTCLNSNIEQTRCYCIHNQLFGDWQYLSILLELLWPLYGLILKFSLDRPHWADSVIESPCLFQDLSLALRSHDPFPGLSLVLPPSLPPSHLETWKLGNSET